MDILTGKRGENILTGKRGENGRANGKVGYHSHYEGDLSQVLGDLVVNSLQAAWVPGLGLAFNVYT